LKDRPREDRKGRPRGWGEGILTRSKGKTSRTSYRDTNAQRCGKGDSRRGQIGRRKLNLPDESESVTRRNLIIERG